MSSSIASFFSAVFASEPVHNEAPAAEESNKEVSVEKSEASGDDAPAEEEAEEEEPEDIAPALREECTQSPACAPYAKHFEHCTEKVSSGQGRPHEDCVEELFHLMHCVDNCAAPKLFSKLA